MARSAFQKLKTIYIMDYLMKHTDEAHPATMRQLLEDLESRGISAERKSIYDDIEALRNYGLDIIQSGNGKTSGYYIGSRKFELPELKLLVDSVQSSKFITHRKSNILIKKLESLTSEHEAQALSRQVFVRNRIKTMNESIYYNVDLIHTGIAENKQIQFKYFEYTVNKEKRFKHGGSFYHVSPFALTWDDENYYMIAFDSAAGIIKHYRVDKMSSISVTKKPREGMERYAELDTAIYTRKVFGMFSGQEESVKLQFDNELVGPVLDRLGRDAMLVSEGDNHFTVKADVVVSPQFFAWVCGFGKKAKILSPDYVAQQMAEHVKSIAALYE